jgi:hypothetical protein
MHISNAVIYAQGSPACQYLGMFAYGDTTNLVVDASYYGVEGMVFIVLAMQ